MLLGFFRVCLASMNGQQASLGVSNPLAGAVCVCFVILDFLSEKKCNVDSFLYLSAFPGFKAIKRGRFSHAGFCEVAHFCLICTWLKADPVWALWAPQSFSCWGLDQTSHVPTCHAVNFVSGFHQSSASTVRCSNLTILQYYLYATKK